MKSQRIIIISKLIYFINSHQSIPDVDCSVAAVDSAQTWVSAFFARLVKCPDCTYIFINVFREMRILNLSIRFTRDLGLDKCNLLIDNKPNVQLRKWYSFYLEIPLQIYILTKDGSRLWFPLLLRHLWIVQCIINCGAHSLFHFFPLIITKRTALSLTATDVCGIAN